MLFPIWPLQVHYFNYVDFSILHHCIYVCHHGLQCTDVFLMMW